MRSMRVGRMARLALATCLAMVLAVMVLAGCAQQTNGAGGEAAAAGDETTVTVTDLRGRMVEIPENPQRIVGIGCALRPICYLQAADRVVGVEASEHEDSVLCAYRHVYHDLFSSLPVVGEGGSGGVTPNEEALVAAAPQVIIADSMEADAADALQQKTGIPVVCLDQPETVFDQHYYDNIVFLGEVLGVQQRAQEVVDYLKDVEADLAKRAASAADAGAVSAYAAGISYRGGHGFDGTEANFPPFVSCDVTNVADGQAADGPFTIDLEAVSVAQPDCVFIESSNLSLVQEGYANNPQYFDSLNAVQQGNTYTLISYRFYSTNVELALANCYQVGSVMYPDAFADVDATEKLDEISEFFLGASLSSDLAAEGCEFKQVDITR